MSPCRWTFDNDTVYHDFDADQLLNYDRLLPPMMADGIRVMIYVGMEMRLHSLPLLEIAMFCLL